MGRTRGIWGGGGRKGSHLVLVVRTDGKRTLGIPRRRREDNINLYAPCILYIGQPYRYSPEYTFYVFSQQIYYLIIFF